MPLCSCLALSFETSLRTSCTFTTTDNSCQQQHPCLRCSCLSTRVRAYTPSKRLPWRQAPDTVCVLRSAIGLRSHTYIAMGRCESDNICLGRGEDRGIRLERNEVACFIPIFINHELPSTLMPKKQSQRNVRTIFFTNRLSGVWSSVGTVRSFRPYELFALFLTCFLISIFSNTAVETAGVDKRS